MWCCCSRPPGRRSSGTAPAKPARRTSIHPIKVGVVGCGYWGPKLARNFHALADTELAWAADFYPARLEHMRSLYPEVRTTQSYAEVLASDVEAVVIATPVSTH